MSRDEIKRLTMLNAKLADQRKAEATPLMWKIAMGAAAAVVVLGALVGLAKSVGL